MESARYKPVLLPTGRHYNGIALEVFSNAETIYLFLKKKKKKKTKKTNKQKPINVGCFVLLADQ